MDDSSHRPMAMPFGSVVWAAPHRVLVRTPDLVPLRKLRKAFGGAGCPPRWGEGALARNPAAIIHIAEGVLQ